MRRRFVVFGLVLAGLGLIAGLDATVATGPALGLTGVAAWMLRG